ncbi:MAG: hypothetical protein NTZ51_09790 [Proteobacteria bacterium]|nr:hypothetical protein [Pseudomonadota bacterium]
MQYRFSILKQVQIGLGRQSAIFWTVLAACVLTLPSLFNGLAGDDYFIRAVALQNTDIPGVPASIFDAFPFTKGDPAVIKQGIDAGLYPWWTHPQHQITFFRPLSSLTHWLDFKLFSGSVWLMHIHSILWYALLVFVTGLLYRRFLAPCWVAGLAALLYAIDYSHAVGAASLCNRYAVIAAVFGFLTLLAHDRWRHDGSKSCSVLAPGCFIIALLSGEAGVAAGGYLIAYAVFLDRGKPLSRYAVLLPYVLVGIVWRIIYSALEYGAAHSGIYVDPAKDSIRFLIDLAQRLPVLLLGQLALPNSDLWSLLPALPAQLYVLFSLACIFFAAWVVWPLLRRDRAICFFALGMILAAIPFCATLPSNRFLFFTGLGCMGLIAHFFATALERPAWFVPCWRRPHKVLAYAWVFIHMVISPLLLAPSTLAPLFIQQSLALAAETIALPQQPPPPGRLVVVNVPSDLMLFYLPFIRAADGQSTNLRTFLLSAGMMTLEAQRVDDRTLVVRLNDGLLAGVWNQFFRDPVAPLKKGYTLKLSDLSVTVTGVTDTGLPAEIRYEFTVPLEDDSLRWVTWSEYGFIPFALPSPGETVRMKPLSMFWPLRILFHDPKG